MHGKLGCYTYSITTIELALAKQHMLLRLLTRSWHAEHAERLWGSTGDVPSLADVKRQARGFRADKARCAAYFREYRANQRCAKQVRNGREGGFP